mmetsp:Transcript_44121/g.84318  ORF Transcript_44121/g.84318 Transcript_44121/m.84318 type:complete len:217 (-) Transcript_44121:2395-3045(-)
MNTTIKGCCIRQPHPPTSQYIVWADRALNASSENLALTSSTTDKRRAAKLHGTNPSGCRTPVMIPTLEFNVTRQTGRARPHLTSGSLSMACTRVESRVTSSWAGAFCLTIKQHAAVTSASWNWFWAHSMRSASMDRVSGRRWLGVAEGARVSCTRPARSSLSRTPPSPASRLRTAEPPLAALPLIPVRSVAGAWACSFSGPASSDASKADGPHSTS